MGLLDGISGAGHAPTGTGPKKTEKPKEKIVIDFSNPKNTGGVDLSRLPEGSFTYEQKDGLHHVTLRDGTEISYPEQTPELRDRAASELGVSIGEGPSYIKNHENVFYNGVTYDGITDISGVFDLNISTTDEKKQNVNLFFGTIAKSSSDPNDVISDYSTDLLNPKTLPQDYQKEV